MKRLLLILALLCLPTLASAQCNGVFPANTVCGTVAGGVPKPTGPAAFQGSAGGTNGQIQYNSSGTIAGFGPITGDINLSVPGAVATIQNKTGNGAKIATSTGSLITNNCVKIDANGNLVDAGTTCAAQNIGACNVVSATGATSITSGTATLTVVGANFQPGDVGKIISVPGAGTAGSTLNTSIITRTSTTQVTLNTNAATTLSAVSKTVIYGTDDTAAFQAALSDTTTGLVNFAGGQGCMITDTLLFNVNKVLTASVFRTILYYRQIAGTVGKPAFTILVNGVVLQDFNLDYDAGSTVTSLTDRIFAINCVGSRITVNRITLNGNSSVQRMFIGGIGYFGTLTKVTNSTLSNLSTYVLAADSAASYCEIYFNKIDHGPTITNAAGMIAFLSGGVTQAMSNLRIIGNYVDMSDLSVANMNSALYIAGGASNPAYYYTEVVVANNIFIGTPGGTASTTAGVILQYTDRATISGNDIRYIGECIGSGSDNASITGNVLYGCGTYGMEVSGNNVTISNNIINTAGQSPFGISMGNCSYCNINNNVIQASSSPNGFWGIYIYATSGFNANSISVSDNNIITTTQINIIGIYFNCMAGSVQCIGNSIVGNTVAGGSTGSYGIRVESSAGTSTGWLIGPSNLAQAIGVSVATSAGSLCYVAGMNRSTTKTAGGAFPGACQ